MHTWITGLWLQIWLCIYGRSDLRKASLIWDFLSSQSGWILRCSLLNSFCPHGFKNGNIQPKSFVTYLSPWLLAWKEDKKSFSWVFDNEKTDLEMNHFNSPSKQNPDEKIEHCERDEQGILAPCLKAIGRSWKFVRRHCRRPCSRLAGDIRWVQATADDF